ncbi:hypothetical protein FHG87_016159 [Trinorchestia longiramus]|nr:hypothetical protein FHG87_016159 [Trinorchestia longiramus]
MLHRKRLKTLIVVLAVTTCIYVYACINLRPSRHGGQSPGRRLHIVRITNEDMSKLGRGVESPDLPPPLLYPRAPPSVTAIPPPSPLLAVPSQFFPATRGEDSFLYDASDVLNKPRTSTDSSELLKLSSAIQVAERRPLNPVDLGDQNSIDLRDQKPVDLGDQNPVDLGDKNPVDLGDQNPVDLSVQNPIDLEDHKPSNGKTRSPVKIEIDGNSDGETQRDNSAYTVEKEVIALAQLGPLPRMKQKKLEMYLAHLSSNQFEEVYRNIVGYDKELSNDYKIQTYDKELNNGNKVGAYDNKLNNVGKVPAALHSNTLDDHKSGVKGNADSHLMLPGKSFGLTAGARSQALRRCGDACVGHKHTPLSVRGYGARVEIESLTLPPDWTSTPEVEERLKWRRQHIKDVSNRSCHTSKLTNLSLS